MDKEKMELIIELDHNTGLIEKNIIISNQNRSEYNKKKLDLINILVKKIPKTKLDMVIKFSKYYDEKSIYYNNLDYDNNEIFLDFIKNY